MICTGYVAKAKTPIPADQFFSHWLENTRKANPVKIFVACAGGNVPLYVREYGLNVHECSGDLGHIRDKHEGRTSWPFTGWAAGMLLGVLAAYNEGLDAIYKEQDQLAFGGWAEQLYADKGPCAAVLGQALRPPHAQLKSSQSLFLVEHAQIPQFVADYINKGHDMATGPTTGENKFRRMIEEKPNTYGVQKGNWNVDRDRPLPFHRETWAAQQITLKEFQILKVKGLI
jgi:hypothetical protein